MKKTAIFITALIAGLSAAVGLADTKDTWQLKMNFKDGNDKTLLLEGVDSIILGGKPEKEVKPGDVDENGDPLLMDVSYKHYYNWIWYHDNLPNCTYTVVERTRTFSDGSVVTDEFRDYAHPCDMYFSIIAEHCDPEEDYIGGCYTMDESKNIFPTTHTSTPQDYTLFRDVQTLFKRHEVIGGNIPTLGERYIVSSGNVELIRSETELSYKATHSIGVDYLNGLYIWRSPRPDPPYGQWNKYILSILYTIYNDSEDTRSLLTGVNGLPMGWYFMLMERGVQFSIRRNVAWDINDDTPWIGRGSIDFNIHDQYFVDDVKMVDFLDVAPKVEFKEPTLERITTDRGNCMLMKYEVNTETCGITQNVFIADTIYEIKYPTPVLRYITPLRGNDGGFIIGDFDHTFSFIEDAQSYNMISSLQPIVQIAGEGYTVEVKDMGEEPNCTNHSLPFHNWEITINSEKNLTDTDRHGTFRLMDAYGKPVQTISLLTEKKPEWYEEDEEE